MGKKIDDEFNERISLVIKKMALDKDIRYKDMSSPLGITDSQFELKRSLYQWWKPIDVYNAAKIFECDINDIFLDALTLDIDSARIRDIEITRELRKSGAMRRGLGGPNRKKGKPGPSQKIKWLTRKQAAQRLGISISYVDDLANDGKLRRYKIGERIIRFRQDELDDDISKMIDEQGISL